MSITPRPLLYEKRVGRPGFQPEEVGHPIVWTSPEQWVTGANSGVEGEVSGWCEFPTVIDLKQ